MPNTEKQYHLKIDTKKSVSKTIINDSGASGRDRVTLSVLYKLTDLSSGKVISRGQISVNDSFDIGGNRFANYVNKNEVQSYLTKAAAENIRDNLVYDIKPYILKNGKN